MRCARRAPYLASCAESSCDFQKASGAFTNVAPAMWIKCSVLDPLVIVPVLPLVP